VIILASMFSVTRLTSESESRIKVRADKGSNRQKVEPLSARTFILATFFPGS
jgi:hypothetical protein